MVDHMEIMLTSKANNKFCILQPEVGIVPEISHGLYIKPFQTISFSLLLQNDQFLQ